MKLKVIACEAFTLEFNYCRSESPHELDFTFQQFGLHDTPDELRAELQNQIDLVPEGEYDYILVGYALCSRGTAGITTQHTPLVLFQAHDCITVFLGSRRRYMEEFTKQPGTYYYSPGWVERKEAKINQKQLKEVQERIKKTRYQQYVEKYGEDNAKYLIEMESQWVQNYTRAAFVNMDIGDIEKYREFTKNVAKQRNWSYEELQGELTLVRKFLSGEWDDDFLIVQPGQKIADVYMDKIIDAR